MNWELLPGLIAIAVAIFFGLYQTRRGIFSELREIRDRVEPIKDIANSIGVIKDRTTRIEETTDKTWDLISSRLTKEGTIKRKLNNLGEIKITAEPEEDRTRYIVETQAPVLRDGLISKLSKETEFAEKERKMFGEEPRVTSSSPTRLLVSVPSTNPKVCTKYINLFLRWLDSDYFKGLEKLKEFEEPILKE